MKKIEWYTNPWGYIIIEEPMNKPDLTPDDIAEIVYGDHSPLQECASIEDAKERIKIIVQEYADQYHLYKMQENVRSLENQLNQSGL